MYSHIEALQFPCEIYCKWGSSQQIIHGYGKR